MLEKLRARLLMAQWRLYRGSLPLEVKAWPPPPPPQLVDLYIIICHCIRIAVICIQFTVSLKLTGDPQRVILTPALKRPIAHVKVLS
jgi:hypothetical protein